jgi:membrane protein implicated in regulation of membrane protease activity
MTESTIWWVLAGSVVAVELITGTFYLLMLSLGLMAAAIAAQAGATTAVQILIAAVVGGGSVVVFRLYKKTRPAPFPTNVDSTVNLDIGETVQVDAWSPDGTSLVKYRGANWHVALAAGGTPSPGPHRIIEVVGSRLIVKKF